MSNTLMKIAKSAQTTPSAKAVLMALADLERDDGRPNFPSIRSLSEYTCYTERTVIAAVQRLERLGWVVCARALGRATRYRLIPDRISESCVATHHQAQHIDFEPMKPLHTSGEAVSPLDLQTKSKAVKPAQQAVQQFPTTPSPSPRFTHQIESKSSQHPLPPTLSAGELIEAKLLAKRLIGTQDIRTVAIRRAKVLAGLLPSEDESTGRDTPFELSAKGPEPSADAG